MGKISCDSKGHAALSKENVPTKVTLRIIVFGFPGRMESSFLRYRTLRTQHIQNIGLILVAVLAGNCKEGIKINSDYIWTHAYNVMSLLPFLTNFVLVSRAPRLAEVVACMTGIFAGLITLARAQFSTSTEFNTSTSDAVLLYWVAGAVLVQMRSVCVVINRLVMYCSHLSLLLALGMPFMPALLRTMYMTVVAAAVGIGMDHFYRKGFLLCVHSRKVSADGLMQGSCPPHYHASTPTAAPHIEATPITEVSSEPEAAPARCALYCPALMREATSVVGLAGTVAPAVCHAVKDMDDDCMHEWDLNMHMRGHSPDHTPKDVISSLSQDEIDALPIAIDQVQNLHRALSFSSTSSSISCAFIASHNFEEFGVAQVNVSVPWARQSDLPADVWGRVESGLCSDEIQICGLSIINLDGSPRKGELI